MTRNQQVVSSSTTSKSSDPKRNRDQPNINPSEEEEDDEGGSLISDSSKQSESVSVCCKEPDSVLLDGLNHRSDNPSNDLKPIMDHSTITYNTSITDKGREEGGGSSQYPRRVGPIDSNSSSKKLFYSESQTPKLPLAQEKPKRPKSAYILFLDDFRKKYFEKFPNTTFNECQKSAGKEWKTLSEQEKQPWKDLQMLSQKEFIQKMYGLQNTFGLLKSQSVSFQNDCSRDLLTSSSLSEKSLKISTSNDSSEEPLTSTNTISVATNDNTITSTSCSGSGSNVEELAGEISGEDEKSLVSQQMKMILTAQHRPPSHHNKLQLHGQLAKEPKNAFSLYVQAMRSEFEKTDPSITYNAIQKQLSTKWREMEPGQRAEWAEKARALKRRRDELDAQMSAEGIEQDEDRRRVKKKIFVPKGPRSAYTLFFQSARKQLYELRPELGFEMYPTICSKIWHDMAEEEKTLWKTDAANDRLRYEKELRALATSEAANTATSIVLEEMEREMKRKKLTARVIASTGASRDHDDRTDSTDNNDIKSTDSSVIVNGSESVSLKREEPGSVEDDEARKTATHKQQVQARKTVTHLNKKQQVQAQPPAPASALVLAEDLTVMTRNKRDVHQLLQPSSSQSQNHQAHHLTNEQHRNSNVNSLHNYHPNMTVEMYQSMLGSVGHGREHEATWVDNTRNFSGREDELSSSHRSREIFNHGTSQLLDPRKNIPMVSLSDISSKDVLTSPRMGMLLQHDFSAAGMALVPDSKVDADNNALSPFKSQLHSSSSSSSTQENQMTIAIDDNYFTLMSHQRQQSNASSQVEEDDEEVVVPGSSLVTPFSNFEETLFGGSDDYQQLRDMTNKLK